jgi:hypothetical protein
MKIEKTSVIMFSILGFTTALMVVAVIVRKHHPVNLSPGGVPATESNRDYRKTEASWLTNQFETFSTVGLAQKVSALSVHMGSIVEDAFDKKTLETSSEKVLRSLKAESFDEFLNYRSDGSATAIRSDAVIQLQARLKRFFLKAGQPAPTRDLDVVKAYWSAVTQNGDNSNYWEGICWDKSWVWVQTLTNEAALSDQASFGNFVTQNAPNCGIVVYPSIFEYDPKPKQILASKENTLLSSVAFILVKNTDNIAYPIVIQSYWAPSIHTWLPSQIGICYVGKRKFDPVF